MHGIVRRIRAAADIGGGEQDFGGRENKVIKTL
jgi:hypothetical protein